MAQSSIHIEKGKLNFFKHNDRTNFTINSVFFNEQNELWSVENLDKFFMSEIEKRKRKYEKLKNRKLHSKTLTHLSSIINLESHHNLSDLELIKNHLENTLGTRVVQIAIHRDEGYLINKKTGEMFTSGKDFFANPKNKKLYFDKEFNNEIDQGEYKIKKNYHAHIEFLGLDKNGMSIRRKLSRAYLSQLQTKVADILRMQRGINYAKEKKPRPRRLSTYEYKRVKASENKVNASSKMLFDVSMSMQDDLDKLKIENKKLRAELQEMGAVREDYARLEAINKQLRIELESSKIELDAALNSLISLKKELNIVIEERNNALNDLEVAETQLESKNDLEEKLEQLTDENKELKKENQELRLDISSLLDFAKTAKKLIMKVLKIDISSDVVEAHNEIKLEVKKREVKKKSRAFER